MTTLHIRNSISRSPLRRGFLLVPVVLVCFALSPKLKSQQPQCGGCYATNCGTAPIAEYAPAPCIGCNDQTYLGNTAYGCSSLINATVTQCDDNMCGPDGGHYTGANMSFNTAFGSHALNQNDTGGNYNSAYGADALYSNTSGYGNTAIGYKALHSSTTSPQSTAVGYQALMNAVRGANEAFGANALFHNTLGIGNTALGLAALNYNTTGYYNVGIGDNAGALLTTGSGNVCIGWNVFGVAGESNTTHIRNVYSSVASARPVYVNSNNKIGTLASTRRVKENIKPMGKASEAILALQPVSFRYKKEIDASGAAQFGLIAEEVAEVDPDLVSRDGEGKPEAVRYESVNAMLLNEFLKEHRKVEKQETTIAQLQSTVAQEQKDFQATAARQQAQIEALTAGLQKVSAQIELSKAAPRTVLNNQ